MSITETLTELAEEHLARMATVSWADFAACLRNGRAGETFGCEVDGRYFDVGDQACWLDRPEGDILLVCHAAVGDTSRAERQTVIRRP